MRQDDLYHQLAFYTLAHPDPAFIHQHAVDAYAAQTADESTRTLALVFALIGLYLHVEKGYTGKQVQRAHMHLAKWPRTWPKLPPPALRGEIDIRSVLATAPGPARDRMIDQWSKSVWESWRESHAPIVAIGRKYLGIE